MEVAKPAEFVPPASSRRGGRGPVRKTKVVVDLREFRSSLPSLLHARGLELSPVPLVGGGGGLELICGGGGGLRHRVDACGREEERPGFDSIVCVGALVSLASRHGNDLTLTCACVTRQIQSDRVHVPLLPLPHPPHRVRRVPPLRPHRAAVPPPISPPPPPSRAPQTSLATFHPPPSHQNLYF